MAHEESVQTIKSNDQAVVEVKTIEQQLIDANDEIESLKMEIVWLQRSYE